MKFEIRQPTKLLRPWIECYWNVQLSVGADVKNEVILPNGKTEMIFALEGHYQVTNRKTHTVKQAWLSGLHHEPLEIQYKGKSNLIGIRFYPHGLFPFLDIPIQETVNQVENVSSIWGVLQDEILETIATTTEQENIYCALDQFLIRKISEKKTNNHHLIGKVVNDLKTRPSQSIPELASAMGYTQRHFNRLFKDHTGMNPKLMAQIFRFEQAYSYLHASSEEGASILISTLGYYDQAHFNKEFKRFSGMTPTEYKKRAIDYTNFL